MTNTYIEAYLDAEEKFYDYHTQEIVGTDIFDTTTAGIPYYTNLLNNKLENKHNITYEIQYLTPDEYYEICAKDVFGTSVERLKMQRRNDAAILEHLKEVILTYHRKFPITYINYADHAGPQQEGLHRMMVAGDLFGWNTKFPVLIINWKDKDLADKEKQALYKDKIERNLRKAITRSLYYKYNNIDDLKDQLLDDITDELQYLSEFDRIDIELARNNSDNGFTVTINDYYTAELLDYEIQFIDHNTADSDLDDIDLDDEDLDLWF